MMIRISRQGREERKDSVLAFACFALFARNFRRGSWAGVSRCTRLNREPLGGSL